MVIIKKTSYLGLFLLLIGLMLCVAEYFWSNTYLKILLLLIMTVGSFMFVLGRDQWINRISIKVFLREQLAELLIIPTSIFFAITAIVEEPLNGIPLSFSLKFFLISILIFLSRFRNSVPQPQLGGEK